MRDLLYLELRNVIKEINQSDRERDSEVIASIERMVHLAQVGRVEGLLALERESLNLHESEEKDLKYMQIRILHKIFGNS